MIATMNMFLRRHQVVPTLPTIDVDASWNRTSERYEEHVPREIVADDDGCDSGDNEEPESDEDCEFEIFDDEEANQSECSGDSATGDFLVIIQGALRVESLKSNDGCKKNKDGVSLVEYHRIHDFWIRTEAVSCTCENFNCAMVLIGCH